MSDDHKIHKRVYSTNNAALEKELNPLHVGFGEENDGVLPLSNRDIDNSAKLKPKKANKKFSLSAQDRPAFFVLVVLYLLQGVPVGLAFGSIPFMLKSKLSYSQVGVFSLAAYPYSLKLLWSPIVDSFYSPKIGRRKSWIIPVQAVSGVTLIILGSFINGWMEDPSTHLIQLTSCFFLLVFFCATQDIAVDGWALTCLSPESLSFASTAQTIGINTGYFSSFTIFLALSSPDFANKYLRSVPLDSGLFSLGSYLAFFGWVYLIVTGLVYIVPEDPPHLVEINRERYLNEKVKDKTVYNNQSNKWDELKNVYLSMYKVLKLSNVQTFVVILLLAKLGFQVNEAATNLKLLERGLSKEDLSITVLIDFPFEMIFGFYAGRWSNGKSPLRPWIIGFAGRLLAAVFAHLLVYYFPSGGEISSGYFLLVIIQHLFSSFMSTIQFVSLCAFHTRIADPSIGGTYMTTLNTLSNYGGTWPRFLIFYFIDKLTAAKCYNSQSEVSEYWILNEQSKDECKNSGGQVITLRDGYFYMNFICVSLGVCILFWVKKRLTHLQSLPNSAWRVNKDS